VGEIRKRHEPRATKRSPLPIVLVAIVLLVGIGGGVFLMSQEKNPPAREPGKDVSKSTEPEPAPEQEPEAEPEPAPTPEPSTPEEAPASADPSRMWLVEPAFAPGIRGKLVLAASSTAILPSDRNRAVEVGVLADGTLWIAGKEGGLSRLKEVLFMHADLSRDEEHPSQPSNTPVLITADERVRWRVVQYVMQAGADPAVRMWKLNLAVSTPDGERVLDIPIPNDRGRSLAQTRRFKIELKRIKGDQATRVEMDGAALGPDDFDYLAEMLEVKIENYPDATAELHAWAWVPLRHVVLALDKIRGVGIKDITFIGAPPSETDIVKDVPAIAK